MTKAWWKSKTLWVNALALTAMIASGEAGVEIPANVAVPVLAIANALLRMVTSQAVGAADEASQYLATPRR